ncbi:uncharacterized protein METZ01_LOCUS243244 [marine metagenome]|uniref:Uncharacterized protein n=1 Tax=marine metagenome TaxID=408172 RepID=A0A382HSZ3_9ZZZZ
MYRNQFISGPKTPGDPFTIHEYRQVLVFPSATGID